MSHRNKRTKTESNEDPYSSSGSSSASIDDSLIDPYTVRVRRTKPKPNTKSNWVMKVIEFKFEADKTPCMEFKDDKGNKKTLNGVFHIPLMQCQDTGRFQPIAGTTEFQVIAKCKDFDVDDDDNDNDNDDSSSPKDMDMINININNHKHKHKHKRFTGTIVAKKVGEKTSVESMNLGFGLKYEWSYDDEDGFNDPSETGTFVQTTGDETKDFTTTPFLKKNDEDIQKKIVAHLNKWMENAGGYLYFYSHQFNKEALDNFDVWKDNLDGIDSDDSDEDEHEQQNEEEEHLDYCKEESKFEADYMLKIYAVLSAHKPNETLPLVAPPEGTKPDWDALEKLVSLRLDKDMENMYDEIYIKGLVQDYKLFLELKRDFNDFEHCLLFSPSMLVDECWHAHLSFLDRYQKDIMALMGKPKLIEHEPILGDEAKLRYVTTYNALKKLKGDDIGRWSGGWPKPDIKITSSNEGGDVDSDADFDANDEIKIIMPFESCSCG